MKSFRIAGRLIDLSLNRVTNVDGATAQVEPKVMKVLAALAERPGEVVTRDELMAQVWSGVYVTDDALHRTIRELRRLFDDDAESPTVIETIRKRGYRLIASVEPGDRPGDRFGDGSGDGSGDRPGARSGVRPGDRSGDRSGVRPGDRSGMRSVIAAGAVVAVAIIAVARFTTPTDADRTSPLEVTFTPFTSDPGNEVDPALSASGKLAYVARGTDGRAHIFVKPTADDSPAVQITNGPGTEHAPVWSPDETQIAFVRTDGSGCHITLATARGDSSRAIAPCLSPDEWKMSWSPDGARLAATAGRGSHASPSHIALLTIANGQHTAVTTPPAGYVGDYAPAISPDGRSLAFVRVLSGGITSLCVMPLDRDGAVTTLTADDADVLGADWTPSGTHLIFSSDRAGAISIWRIAANPRNGVGQPELIAGGGNKLKHPSVARGTGAIAYEDWQYEINLREIPTTADTDGADTATAISPTTDRWNFHPQISPDGKRIAFQSTRSGSYEIWVGNRDGSGVRQLTHSYIYKSMPRWSPDGRSVVFTLRNETNGRDVVVADADSGALRVVASGRDPLTLIAPSWSADGRRLYAGNFSPTRADSQGPSRVCAIEMDSGRGNGECVEGSAAVESPDGRSLYVASLDKAGLWRDRRDRSGRTLVTNHLTADQWPNWGVTDDGVFYVSYPDDGDPQLFIVDGNSAMPRPMTRLPEMAWPGIAVSRDGSRVIYARADRRSANIGGVSVR